ncbi:IS1595 family transposase [Xanthomonas axonopodis pv. vasculorum]|uniref:Transposase n=2 Tax=Xanthomonas axonopodis TaxID=53413 RepID=A0A098Q3H6_9XANT|nr:transposase [Xanthomonas axonopodis]KGE53571.1 transposase [Xanthomonas axonopodis pv. vasculorum]QKD85206.1 DDE transposase [Xanthomonas axonopodis pv. vasculorum]
MGINIVQFPPGLSLTECVDRYGTEAKCDRALHRWRWPKGFRCPQCDGRARSRFRRGEQVYDQCRACRHQTTLRAGTLLQSSKLPLRLWMQAIYLLTSSKTDHNHEHPVFAVIEPVKAFDNALLKDWIERRLEPGCEVYSDGLACFRRLEEAGHAHTSLDTGGGRATTEVQGARWLNMVLANVKRAISGTYHAMRQAKYARRYLAEAAYRFNRRFRLKQMLPRLATALMRCQPCPERVLRMASNFHG